jgi:(E)-4-hydroxy-3-methylbut-2-enyl-diphosphate synthase
MTREVSVGGVGVGGTNPVRLQSMTTAAPQDIDGTVAECVRLHAAGCEITRISTPKVPDAAVLRTVKDRLAAEGIPTPLVADIHFVPAAAMEAAKHADKVRINPGNFADHKAGQSFDYSDEAYDAEIGRIREKVTPLIKTMKERDIAMRIGTNHGSLSDRIMCRYGDTPQGMVESALEYVRICEENDYRNIILSMKASNPRIMIEAYRQLVMAMDKEGMSYPLHLGVTEAGEGEDGRIKSAVGIGTLLADGIGDTIRVSLAEPPEDEIPVARELAALFANAGNGYDTTLRPLTPRRTTSTEGLIGGRNPVRIFGAYESPSGFEIPCEVRPNEVEGLVTIEQSARWTAGDLKPGRVYRLLLHDPATAVHFVRRVIPAIGDAPVILAYRYSVAASPEVAAAVAIGGPLIEGCGDAIEILEDEARPLPVRQRHNLAISVLQNSLTRISRVDIIACPSCGRTLFDLPEVTQLVKKRFSHLKGVKIAVMGCIVNGPGEMADADFGFVGGAPGKINLYKGYDCVEKGIPIKEAYDRMVDLIKRYEMWVEP